MNWRRLVPRLLHTGCQAAPLASSILMPAASAALAQSPNDCADLDAATRARVQQLPQRRFRTEPFLPAIDQEERVPGTCYWRLSISNTGPAPRVTLYVSPDKRFVFSGMWDLSVDPAIVEAEIGTRLIQEAVADGAPSRGRASATVTVVVFGDFLCPHCATFAESVDRFLEEHPDAIRVIYRNAALGTRGWGYQAALASFCVAEQNSDAFWKLHGFLYASQSTMTLEQFPSVVGGFVARLRTIDPAKYATCMASEHPANRLKQDRLRAISHEVRAVPTVFINGRRYPGFRDRAAFTAAISAAADVRKAGELEVSQ